MQKIKGIENKAIKPVQAKLGSAKTADTKAAPSKPAPAMKGGKKGKC